ncbi:MAG TPA: alpha/beta hydrolase [Chromatiales bacterium]|nr:alpha/beta hydrolase [Thiotrichales bacterium]HIP67397.1 alpha/beta hydrolase [Chromatiales bacterium]
MGKSSLNRWNFLFPFIFLFVLNGCAPHKIYRTEHTLCTSTDPEVECKNHTLQKYFDQKKPDEAYTLGFIEFDDQGQLHQRSQMKAVTDHLNTQIAHDDVLIVVFAHGWKHSAAPGDDNIATLRESLRRLSALESAIAGDNPDVSARHVHGIYLGWRGASVTLPLIKELSFWDRKSTAHKVGFGGVTEVLARLEQVKETRDVLVEGDSRTRLAVVGHSFGGAVIYSALSQLLMERSIDTYGPTGQISDARGFGNLVVLINPAFEAERFSALSNAANERRTYFSSQLPVLAVLTSESDKATKYAFPIGRWFSTLFEKTRDVERPNAVTQETEIINQRKANVSAVGHFEPYRTHYLDVAPESTRDETLTLEADIQQYYRTAASWENDKPGSIIKFAGSILERTENSVGRNPYLVIRVNQALIRNHNDLDDPRIANFVRQLILISGQSKNPDERKMHRSRASYNK